MREVVVMTKEAVEFACTVTAGHAAPMGNGAGAEQVKVYEMAPKSEIVNVADVPAATVLDNGEALKDDSIPFETFSTVLPPAWSARGSGGPNGATMM